VQSTACMMSRNLEYPRPGASGALPNDRELVQKLLAGDEAAFTLTVERYHAALQRLAMVFISDRAVAEEIVQETWLAVLKGLPSFEGRSSLKTWIFKILSNRAKTRAVRERRTIPFSSMGGADDEHEAAVDPSRFSPSGAWAQPPVLWNEDTPERLLMRGETLEVIGAAISRLPPNQQAVLTLRDIEGVDAAEVCNILGISETNQRVLLHRARTRLRGALENHLRVK